MVDRTGYNEGQLGHYGTAGKLSTDNVAVQASSQLPACSYQHHLDLRSTLTDQQAAEACLQAPLALQHSVTRWWNS
jgi:conjugal transfer/entry exclusion protein